MDYGSGIHFLRGLIQRPPASRESRIRMALAQLYVVLLVYMPMASNIMPTRSRMGESVRSLDFIFFSCFVYTLAKGKIASGDLSEAILPETTIDEP